MQSERTQGRLTVGEQAGRVARGRRAGGVLDGTPGWRRVRTGRTWATNLPYLAYPLWLVPTLLLRRGLFTQGRGV